MVLKYHLKRKCEFLLKINEKLVGMVLKYQYHIKQLIEFSDHIKIHEKMLTVHIGVVTR